MLAILNNHAPIVEILLKEFNANPNVVNNLNQTALMYCVVYARGNLSIMKLLTKYGFDYVKLINKRENEKGQTIFLLLCRKKYADDPIACLKYLFQVCKKISNCTINILAKDQSGMTGLHLAIFRPNVDMVRYLLENVYFPNNNKANPDGIAIMNTKYADRTPLAPFVLGVNASAEYNAKQHLEIFKLCVSYGMNIDAIRLKPFKSPLEQAIRHQHAEIVKFMLNENLSPIYTFKELFLVMYKFFNGISSPKDEIWEALFNYGINYNLIIDNYQYAMLIALVAGYSLSLFKTTLSMILAQHGINNLKEHNKCITTNVQTLSRIAQTSDTRRDVKLFIDALISGDESKISKLDTATSLQVTLTCVNNHELKNSNNNKMSNSKQACSVCDDGSESSNGFKCNECKCFICHDCVIVQKISKKIGMIGNENVNLYFANRRDYEMSILKEILQYKHNKKLIQKAKSSIVAC